METSNEKPQVIAGARIGSVTLGWGIILAAVVIVFSLIIFLLDIDRQSWINYFSYVIIIAGIIIAQTTYKNKQLGGFISYGKAFMVGFIMMIYAGIIIAIWTYVFVKFIDPGSLEEALRVSEEKMIERGMSDLEIEQSWPMVKALNSPVAWTLFALLGNILIGIVVSLITAIFIKNEDPNAMPAA
jgi:hypothetical protein